MKFEEAVKLGKEGIKTHRDATFYMIIEDSNIIFKDKSDNKSSSVAQEVTVKDIETNWEIYEEKKTLSDKMYNPKGTLEPAYKQEDVKEYLKELLDYLPEGTNGNSDKFWGIDEIKDKAKRIFGDRLVK